MIELITISKAAGNWYLNKVVINPQHIAMVAESQEHNRLLREGKINLGFGGNIQFSKVQMALTSGFNELIVIGSPAAIMEKLSNNTKQLLKG
jgi:hypothetical protein